MKFFSNINTYSPLGGEGWTRRGYSNPAKNRNILAVLASGLRRFAQLQAEQRKNERARLTQTWHADRNFCSRCIPQHRGTQ